MTNEGTSRSMSSKRRYMRIGLAAVVIVAAVAVAVTAFAGSSLPILAANYRCVPVALIPQLRPGESGTITTSYGGFTATFRASTSASSTTGLNVGMPFRGELTVKRGGESWTLPPPANPGDSQINDLCVIAFQREQDPGVMLEGYTGGAHCCEVPVIYLFNKSENRYDKVVDMSPNTYTDPHAFDHNEGFTPKVVGHRVLLQTGDDRFAYAFGCYACSEQPLILDAVSSQGLSDVTAQHPSLVAADAAAIWKNALVALNGESTPTMVNPTPFGFVAPWVADECALGRGATSWTTVEHLERQGKLSNALYYRATLSHGSFVNVLRAFLLRNDYCVGQI